MDLVTAAAAQLESVDADPRDPVHTLEHYPSVATDGTVSEEASGSQTAETVRHICQPAMSRTTVPISDMKNRVGIMRAT
jgi:hypothetical protein